jgi:hypothetical protein
VLWPLWKWKGEGRREAVAHARTGGGGGTVPERLEEEDERGGRVSARERGGLGRAGLEAKAQDEWGRVGMLGQWRGKRAGERRGKEGRRGWLGQRPSGPVRLAGLKARNE